MTKEQAVEVLRCNTNLGYGIVIENESIQLIKEAIEMAIKALEKQPCDDCENNDGECCRLLFEKSFNKDCVSRQKCKEGMIKYGFHAPDMTVTEFIEDELPSVRPKIPTSDDCVSRQAVLDLSDFVGTMPTIDHYGDTLEEVVSVEKIEALPSVTPKIPASDDYVSRQAILDAITEIDGNINMYIYTNEVREIINELSSVRPIRKAPREDITEDEVKINMLELAFNQVNEQAEGIEILTDKYRLIFKAETRGNKVGWPSLENVREKVEQGDSGGSN